MTIFSHILIFTITNEKNDAEKWKKWEEYRIEGNTVVRIKTERQSGEWMAEEKDKLT